jgi:hypothetical protein
MRPPSCPTEAQTQAVAAGKGIAFTQALAQAQGAATCA